MTQTKPKGTSSIVGRWKAYPAYKDSGVKWLGDIPLHWEVQRLKFACQINPSKSDISYFPTNMDISFLPMEKIGEDGTLSLEEIRLVEQVNQGYTYFRGNYLGPLRFTQKREEEDDHTELPAKQAREATLVCARSTHSPESG